jgi:hypothetical protein
MKQANSSTHQEQPPSVGFALKASLEWNDWFGRLSEATRLPRPVLVDQALSEFARQRGFEAPPHRVPVRR